MLLPADGEAAALLNQQCYRSYFSSYQIASPPHGVQGLLESCAACCNEPPASPHPYGNAK